MSKLIQALKQRIPGSFWVNANGSITTSMCYTRAFVDECGKQGMTIKNSYRYSDSENGEIVDTHFLGE